MQRPAPDFRTTAQMMSGDSLTEYAIRGRPHERAIAKQVIRERIRRGDIDDLDCLRLEHHQII